MLAYCVSCECYFRYLQRQGIFFKRESNKRRDNVKKSSWLSWLWQRRSTKLHSSIPPKCTSSSSLILPAPPKLAAGHWRPSGLERPYLQVQQKCIGPSRRLKCRSRKRENRRFARRRRRCDVLLDDVVKVDVVVPALFRRPGGRVHFQRTRSQTDGGRNGKRHHEKDEHSRFRVTNINNLWSGPNVLTLALTSTSPLTYNSSKERQSKILHFTTAASSLY